MNNNSLSQSFKDNENNDSHETQKTSLLYKLLGLFFVALIIFVHFMLYRKEALFNPLAVVVCLLSFALTFKKLTYLDLLFASRFSILFIMILLSSCVLNGILDYPNEYLTMFMNFYVIILGMLWAANNPTANFVLLKRKYKDLNIITVLFYLLFGGGFVFWLSIYWPFLLECFIKQQLR